MTSSHGFSTNPSLPTQQVFPSRWDGVSCWIVRSAKRRSSRLSVYRAVQPMPAVAVGQAEIDRVLSATGATDAPDEGEVGVAQQEADPLLEPGPVVRRARRRRVVERAVPVAADHGIALEERDLVLDQA